MSVDESNVVSHCIWVNDYVQRLLQPLFIICVCGLQFSCIKVELFNLFEIIIYLFLLFIIMRIHSLVAVNSL